MRLLPLFLLLSFSASAQTPAFPSTPVQYNDMLSSFTDSLFLLGQEWGRIFNEAYKTGNYTLLKPKAENIRRYAQKSVTILSAINDLKESKPLRLSIINLINFETRMIDRGFKPFESFNTNTRAATVSAALANLKKLSAEEKTYLTAIGGEQDKYAAANGFKLAAE